MRKWVNLAHALDQRKSSKKPSPTSHTSSNPLFVVTLVTCLVYETFALTANGWGPLIVPLAAQLSLSIDQAGLIFVSWSFGYLPGTLVGGWFLDRYGASAVFLFSLLFMCGGLGFFLLEMVFHLTWLPALGVCAGLAGVGGGTIDASANGMISSMYAQRRGAALNLFTALYPLAALVIALIEGGFLYFFPNDARPSLFLLFGLGVATFIAVLITSSSFHRARGARQQQSTSTTLPKRDIQRTKIMRSLLPVLAAVMLLTGFTATIRTWTPAYLSLAYKQAPAFAATLSGSMNILVIVFRLFVAFVVEKIGKHRTILLGLLIAIGGLLCTLISHSNAFAGAASLTITAIGLTPLVATFVALGNEQVNQRVGSMTGAILGTAGVSSLVWSGLFGVVLSHAGPSWAILFCLAPLSFGGIVTFYLMRY